MDTVIDRAAGGLSAVATFLATSGVAFVIFAVAWVAFGVGILVSQGSVTAAWDWVRSLPLLVQLLAWLLFLPVMAGLWIWETAWPFVVRLALVGSLAAWSLYIFFPRAALAAR